MKLYTFEIQGRRRLGAKQGAILIDLGYPPQSAALSLEFYKLMVNAGKDGFTDTEHPTLDARIHRV